MRLVLWLLLSSLIAYTVLGTGCVQKIERTTPQVESQILTPTPQVVIKYLERPTNPPVSLPINTPIPKPTPTPLVVNEPRELLKIIEPHDGRRFRKNVIVVRGKSQTDAEVLVNGAQARIDDDGNFWYGVGLTVGNNQIDISAQSKDGKEVREVLNVVLLSNRPLFLSIREPLNHSLAVNSSISVSGLTTPDAEITVQGVEIEVKTSLVPDLPEKELGIFHTEIPLIQGANHIEVIATNSMGQTITTDLVVAYLP